MAATGKRKRTDIVVNLILFVVLLALTTYIGALWVWIGIHT